KKAGDNPHLWYNPATVKAVGNALSVGLAMIDPAHRADYQRGAAAFAASLEPLEAKIADMRKKYAGQPVAASEPVFGYMAELLGLKVHNEKFALAVMNNTEPSASDIAAFEKDLRAKQVRVLIYNSQATEALTQRMLKLARQSHVPSVSVTETKPPHKNFQQWMLSQLDELSAALESKGQ
ncbi:MAG TPA: zinc ABC transporter substrate-binding protein, partial [Trinickia sp.]|nr:zinc ABC transporter substrate-binding protein [Trinickia sp.]